MTCPNITLRTLVERGFIGSECLRSEFYESLSNLQISLQSLSYLDNAPRKCVSNEDVIELT